MKIGIYTIHACCNFGALLQSFATVRFINAQGYDCELVNVVSPEEAARMRYRYSWRSLKGLIYNLYALFNPAVHRKIINYSRFRALLPLSKAYSSVSALMEECPVYDLHVVGSDQVWNVEKGECSPLYFLSFLPKDAKKISFSSSFGNLDAARRQRDQITKLLSSFHFLSVREQDAADFLAKDCGLVAENVLDPTFLLDKEWEELAGKEPIVKGPYILYYGFDTNKNCRDALMALRRKLNIPLVGVSVSLHSPYKYDQFIQEAGPKEFLNLIENATFVVTSSFHGAALSVIFERDFAVLRHGTRMSRMESMLSQFCMEDRIVNSAADLIKLVDSSMQIPYDRHSSLVESRRNHTRQVFLKQLPSL